MIEAPTTAEPILSADPNIATQQKRTQRDIGATIGTVIDIGMDGVKTMGDVTLYGSGRIVNTMASWAQKAVRGVTGKPYQDKQ